MLRPAAIALSLALCRCTGIIPGVLPHDIQRDAWEQAKKRCDPDPVDPRIYGRDVLVNVSPYYRHVPGGPSGTESHFAGATLELRPLPGITRELLERGLLCRSAQLMLGRAQPSPDEPYFLPGAWVNVDVDSKNGSFLVRLTGEDDAHGREIYARARAYLTSNGPLAADAAR